MNAEDADLVRAMKAEQLRADIKRESHSTKWYAGKLVQQGMDLKYINLRYGVPTETLERWKVEWERRAKDHPSHVGNHRVLQSERSSEGERAGKTLFGDKDS